MTNNIILASRSGVRKEILDRNGINSEVVPANIDEESIKESLLEEKEIPKTISKSMSAERLTCLRRPALKLT